MTIRLTDFNPLSGGAGASALTSTTVVDNLPPGLQVAPVPNRLPTACDAFIAASGITPGSTSVTFTVNWFDISPCSLSFDVVATAPGTYTNTTQPSTSSPATVPASGASASATLQATTGLGFGKSFTPSSITLGETSNLAFDIVNAAGGIPLSGLAFSDTLPAGLLINTPANLTNTCGGTVTGNAGGNAVQLTGGAIAVGASCRIAVDVRPQAPGTLNNNSTALTSTQNQTAPPATATLNVAAAPPGPPVPPVPPAPAPTPTVVAGATSTPTPTSTPLPPFVRPVIPQVFQNPGVQGIFNGPRNPNSASTPQPRPAPVVAGVSDPPAAITIRPPSTGDAGLLR
jgi:hypothetical protein